MELKIKNPLPEINQIETPTMLLCGPGPSSAHPRVLTALSLPQLGHLDPQFIKICEDIKTLMRYVWQTQELFTLPISGTGSLAWEACVANVTEPGDVHLVCVNGFFGDRHCDMASRYGATVVRLEREWGTVFTLEEIEKAIILHKPQVLWVCHAETSTGVQQPIAGIGDICRQNDCLFMLDAVTSTAGVLFSLDALKVDICYTASQKCISCPPGVSPIMLGARALAKAEKRQLRGEKVKNWNLDMSMLKNYLMQRGDAPRVYHHTAPISMMFALREALTVIAEEGLENVAARHTATATYFWELLENAGIEMLVENKAHRSVAVHSIKVPNNVDAQKALQFIKEKYSIEIGGGLGNLAGKILRVGLMGYNSRADVALRVASAIVEAFKIQGWQ